MKSLQNIVLAFSTALFASNISAQEDILSTKSKLDEARRDSIETVAKALEEAYFPKENQHRVAQIKLRAKDFEPEQAWLYHKHMKVLLLYQNAYIMVPAPKEVSFLTVNQLSPIRHMYYDREFDGTLDNYDTYKMNAEGEYEKTKETISPEVQKQYEELLLNLHANGYEKVNKFIYSTYINHYMCISSDPQHSELQPKE